VQKKSKPLKSRKYTVETVIFFDSNKLRAIRAPKNLPICPTICKIMTTNTAYVVQKTGKGIYCTAVVSK